MNLVLFGAGYARIWARYRNSAASADPALKGKVLVGRISRGDLILRSLHCKLCHGLTFKLAV